ncbi:hypothetical protein LIER_13156 [Lithospermum erythrorhizon]|uniref:Transposase n=1 Tax=Lithospermum erythrorhizon TaxID=34254 RepID=A0AAV3PUU9_LITER
MYNYVQIDEKWFYMTKKSESYYLLPAEEEPVHTCRIKNYIGQCPKPRTHVDPNDEQFQVAATLSGLHLQLICQPPNSLDMNILDLGFFSAIQSPQHKESPRTVEELVQAVVKCFNEYPSRKNVKNILS